MSLNCLIRDAHLLNRVELLRNKLTLLLLLRYLQLLERLRERTRTQLVELVLHHSVRVVVLQLGYLLLDRVESLLFDFLLLLRLYSDNTLHSLLPRVVLVLPRHFT